MISPSLMPIVLFAMVLLLSRAAVIVAGPPPEQINRDEIRTLLPQGSLLASIQLASSTNRTSKAIAPNFLVADLDRDKANELIVAYYTPPHEHTNSDEFYRRSHIMVFKYMNGKYVKAWDSGGWGDAFGARLDPKMSYDEQIFYTRNFFDVRDINGDGQEDIVCTRSSYKAMGDLFEAWTWSGNTLKTIARVGSKVKIVDNTIISAPENGTPHQILVWKGTEFK